MKRRKNILKEASVLLIAAVMLLSTVTVTANTFEDESKQMTQSTEVEYTSTNVLFADTILSEDFEGGIIPPTGWALQQSNPSYTWEIDYSSPHGGTYCASCFYDPGLVPQDEWLITPSLDFRGYGSISLSFWWLMSYYWGVDPYDNYDLNVKISTDGGSNWDLLWNEDTIGTFTDWTWYDTTFGTHVDLSAYIGEADVLIGFQYEGVDGAQISLDDILIYAEAAPMLCFDQVDYIFEECDECIDSYIGQIKVDIVALTSYYEIPTGYLNVMTPMGWVVQNMLISSEFMNEGIPYIATKFGLREGDPCGIDVETLDAYMEFSTTPTPEFYGEEFTTYTVGDDTCYLEGACFVIPYPDDTYFPCYPTQICLQKNHPNVQAACNQCAPAAVANSLQWLENTYGINIPHDNIPGIGITGGAVVPPNSLVGRLDHAMRRGVRSRMDGDGVWPMEGKLRYLDENGLGQSIKVKYQGTIDPGDTTVGNVTAKNKGPVTCQCIIDEIKAGEDVELVIHYPGCGRHAVEVTGAGWICGVQFIQHVSDQKQTHQGDPTDTKGCDTVQTSYIEQIGGKLVVIGGSDPVGTEIEMVYIQSPNDPPNKPEKPDGPTEVEVGTPQTYTTNPATDPDGDAIQQYEWDLGDDGIVVTTTPTVTYTWPNQGTYSVRVRARDEYGAVSDWSDPLPVTVPRNKAYINTPFLNFLQNHPNLFPILRLLLQRLGL